MNWDQIAVAAVIFGALIYLLRRWALRAGKKGGSGCSCGCAGCERKISERTRGEEW